MTRVDPATIPDNGWDDTEDRFWATLPCEALFLEFDTSAHDNDGVPDVSHADVVTHMTGCALCQDCDVRVSVDVNGIGTLEFSAPVDDD